MARETVVQCLEVSYQSENKEIEKLDKYSDLARKLQKLWNIKLTVIPIVVGELGTGLNT